MGGTLLDCGGPEPGGPLHRKKFGGLEQNTKFGAAAGAAMFSADFRLDKIRRQWRLGSLRAGPIVKILVAAVPKPKK